MEEESREILQSVEEALAQEMQQEMRGASGFTPPDGARIAACLHLQRAALRSARMQRERATWKPPLRRPAIRAWVN
jgi:cob(I)alamin adenosyltransferase